jgi:hypothetical protein
MTKRRLFLGFAAAASLFAVFACAQDSPSLGDLARQQRQQKEQAKPVQIKVVTNEEIPEHSDSTPEAASPDTGSAYPSSHGRKESAERVKAQIRAQENQIAILQRRIDEVTKSIPRAPIDCANGCPRWNERYGRKELQIERMQAQLQDEKRHLGEMQESARKQGYGSSVYDP